MKQIKSQFFQKYLLIGLVFFILALTFTAGASGSTNLIKIAVLDSGSADNHEKKVLDLFRKQLLKQKTYRLIPIPIYDQKGDLTVEHFLKALNQAEKQNVQIIHLSWNMAFDKKFDPVISELNRLSQTKIIVAAGGSSQDSKIINLSETVMGKIPKALIVGELSQEKKMKRGAWIGPEMITALVPPVNYSGSSFSAVLLTAELAMAMAKNQLSSANEILNKIKKNREISPDPFPTLKQLLSF